MQAANEGARSVFNDVAISKAETMKAGGQEFTAYTVRVWPGLGFQPWSIKRRFRYRYLISFIQSNELLLARTCWFNLRIDRQPSDDHPRLAPC